MEFMPTSPSHYGRAGRPAAETCLEQIERPKPPQPVDFAIMFRSKSRPSTQQGPRSQSTSAVPSTQRQASSGHKAHVSSQQPAPPSWHQPPPEQLQRHHHQPQQRQQPDSQLASSGVTNLRGSWPQQSPAPAHNPAPTPSKRPPLPGALLAAGYPPFAATGPAGYSSRPATSPSGGRFSSWDSSQALELPDPGMLDGGVDSPLDPTFRKPDPRAVKWFRTNFPACTPTQRTDALTVLRFLESQLSELHQAVTGRPLTAGGPPSRPASPHDPAGYSAAAAGGRARSPAQAGNDPAGGSSPPLPGAPGQPGVDMLGSVRESVLLVREATGFLNPTVLDHQEELFSRCMSELCGQVSSSCIERGYLMQQLWQALRYLLRAALADRDLAWGMARDARRKELAGADIVAFATARLRAEKEEQAKANELLNKRVAMQQAESDKLKMKVKELQTQLGGLAGINPEVLRQQVTEQNLSLLASQKQITALNVRLERATTELSVKDREIQVLAAKVTDTQAEMEAASTELQLRTPRPAQAPHPPWDVLAPEHTTLAVRALREGCTPEDVHRLLIGVSANGVDILPFIDLLGCCRSLNIHTTLEPDAHADPDDSLPRAEASTMFGGAHARTPGAKSGGGLSCSGSFADLGGGLPHQPRASVTRAGAGGDAVGAGASCLRASLKSAAGATDGASAASKPEQQASERRLGSARSGFFSSQAASAAAAASSAAAAAAAAVPGARQQARRVLAALTTPDLPLDELLAFFRELLQHLSVPQLLKYLREPVVQAVSQMLNHGADVDSVACLLIGCMSPGGMEMTRYKSLAGVLSARMSQSAADVGGPITEALSLACCSTADRVLQLEKSLLLQRRRAVKSGWMVEEQRRRESQHRALDEHRMARKVPPLPHPVQTILSQRQLEFFSGLGCGEDIPAVLRHEGKVFHSDMDMREAVRIVRGLWAAKAEAEASTGCRQLLPDFLHDQLYKKYVTSHMVAQTMYNLVSTAAQHMYEPELHMFLQALMGEVEDTLHEDMTEQCQTVAQALAQWDARLNHQVSGWLPKHEIQACVEQQLPHKTSDQVQELMAALDADEPSALVKYQQLFEDNVDGHTSIFSEVLRHQLIQEALQFHQATEEALLEAAEKSNAEAITPAMLIAAMITAHPELDQGRIYELLQRVYGEEVTQALRRGADGGLPKGKAGSKPGLPLEQVLKAVRTVPCFNPEEEEASKAKGKKKDAKNKKKK